MIPNFAAIVAYASTRIGGAMVITIVEMIPTRKIAMVRMFFLFHSIMFKSNI